MQAWRIAKQEHALDRLGTGARIKGQRWNSTGTAVIYAGIAPATAALETLVHTGSVLPINLVLVLIEMPDDSSLYETRSLASLPPDWTDDPSHSAAAIGDKFVADNQHLGLIVPSAIMPEAENIVINPNHPEFRRVTLNIIRKFAFDPRLKKAKS